MGKEEDVYVILEVNKGIPGKYIGARALAKKILRSGYYWSSMVKYSKEYIKKCDQFQRHGDIFSTLSTKLQMLTSP